MPHVVTISCTGDIPEGWVPFISGPSPELGAGKPEDAPTLVPSGPRQWTLQVAVTGAGLAARLSACVPGIRSLHVPDFTCGQGILPLPQSVHWQYTIGSVVYSMATDVYYYSGWPAVHIHVQDGQDAWDLPCAAAGPGRTPQETRWHVRLPTEQFTRRWGFVPCGPHGECDRPPEALLYRPLGTCVYLADGEIFGAEPPTQRSAPRVETLTMHAPALEHTFVMHVVLPRDYDGLTERVFPVVILNDGQNQLTDRGMWGGWHTDSSAARLMRAGRMQEAVLVAVEMHADRNRAYLPRGDARSPQGQAAVYTDFLADHVLPRLRDRYRLASGPGSTAIVGSSNGAIHALFAGLQRPDTFGLVGCLSYARLTPEQNFQHLESLSQVPVQRVYLDSGTRWGEHDVAGRSDDNALITARLRDLLLQRGLVLEQSVRYRLAYGDAHNEGAWRRRIPDCLAFLLPPS